MSTPAAALPITRTPGTTGLAVYRADGRRVLRVVGVRKSFGRGVWPWRRHREILKSANLWVSAGEWVGLVGENGSGKSTLMQIIVGLQASDGPSLCPGLRP